MHDLKAIIKQCFEDMYVVARYYAKADFELATKQGRKWDVARSLVFLKDVANNPDKYFSFENTNADWDARVEQHIKQSDVAQQSIKQYGIDSVRAVTKGSIVWGPANIVFDKIYPIFTGMRSAGLYDFCGDVQDFYYGKHWKNIYVHEEDIKLYAEKMATLAKIAEQKNPIKRKLMELTSWYNISR